MLVGVAVRMSGLAGQGRCTPIPAGFPKVDIRPVPAILSVGLLTPYFSAHFIMDFRYAMSFVILLPVKDRAAVR